MATGKTLKKLMAGLLGIMLFGASANALVLEENFGADTRLSRLGWTSKEITNTQIKADISVLNGKMSIAALGWVPNGYNWGDLYKTFDNEVDTGVMTYSMKVSPTGAGALNNGAENDVVSYTVSLSDGTTNVATLKISANYKFLKVNDTYIAPERNRMVINTGEERQFDLVMDYDNKECYLLIDGVRVATEHNGTEYITAGLLSEKPITRIDIKKTSGVLSYEALQFDDISLHSSDFDEYIFNDSFDDAEKTSIEDYGYHTPKEVYLYRTEDGIHVKNCYTTSGSSLWVSRAFDAISEGKVAFEFEIEAYQADGETRVKPYDNADFPLFSLNEGGINGTKRFTFKTGDNAKLDNVYVNGTKTYTKLTGDEKTWTSDYFTKIRVIADLDNDLVDVYAYNENIMEYTAVLKESIALADGDGIDSICFGRGAFGGSYSGYHHITNFKAYTINEGGYTTPVFVDGGRTVVTTAEPGKTVDIYSAAANVVNNAYAKLIITYYDESDKFISMDTEDFTILSDGIETDISNVELLKASYTFPESTVAGSKFKAFVWNGIDDMIPMTATAEIKTPAQEEVVE